MGYAPARARRALRDWLRISAALWFFRRDSFRRYINATRETPGQSRIGHDGHRRILFGKEFQRGARGPPGYPAQFYGDAVTVETVRQCAFLFRLFDGCCPDGFHVFEEFRGVVLVESTLVPSPLIGEQVQGLGHSQR